jgi:hypothetical protein
MLGRREPRLPRSQIARRISYQRASPLLRYRHWRSLAFYTPRQDPTGHARGSLPPFPLSSSSHLHHPHTNSTQIVWGTTHFNSKFDWPTDGSQPFYLSTGDNTGYGQHGNYVFGWKDDSLQKAMGDAKGCMGANRGSLKTQQSTDGNKCVVQNRIHGEHDGRMTELPGMEGMLMFKTV